jgi:hypothetical protein
LFTFIGRRGADTSFLTELEVDFRQGNTLAGQIEKKPGKYLTSLRTRLQTSPDYVSLLG